MTVGELRETLEGFEDDLEVRLATQPSWPFEWSVQSVDEYDAIARYSPFHDGDGWRVRYEDIDTGEMEICEGGPYASPDEALDDARENLVDPNATSHVVYIYEGEQLGYLPSGAKEGWR